MTLRAMLSPPRLPALWVAFNAGASAALNRASIDARWQITPVKMNANSCT